MKTKVSTLRVLFQVLLHAVLIGHLIAYYALGWTGLGALDFQSFFSDFLGGGVLTAGAVLALGAYALCLLLGRVFCSWGCHFGAFQDLAAWLLRRLGIEPPYVRTRFLHWAPYALLAFLFLGPALRAWLAAGELTFSVNLARPAPWATLPGWIGTAVTFLACGAGILLFLGRRGFCRFVCPYGAAFRVLEPVSAMRVRRVGACGSSSAADPGRGPAHPSPCASGASAPCNLACPTGISVHEETEAWGAVRNNDCVRCHLCIEACPSEALRYSFTPLPVLSARPRERAAVRRPPYSLPLSRELLVAAVAVVSFVAWDLTLAAHFLAATLALGEAFLALAVVETLSRRDLQVLGRIALRHEGRFTLAGLILVSCFFLSLVPLVQGVLFKAHAALGDHAFERAFASHAALASRAGPSPAEAAPAAVALPAAPLLDAAAGARRDRTQALFEAEARYRNALALFPRHYPVLRRYVTVLAELGDPRAHEFFERLREIDPDPRTAALGDWLETRLQRAPGAR